MKKLALKNLKETQSKPHITSSTGASDDYDYDCKSMNEEFTATYYSDSPIKSTKENYSNEKSVADTTSLIINEDYFSQENTSEVDLETKLQTEAAKSEFSAKKNSSELYILQTLKVQLKRDEGLASVGRNDKN